MSNIFILTGVCKDSIIDATLEHIPIAKDLKPEYVNKPKCYLGKYYSLRLCSELDACINCGFNFHSIMAVQSVTDCVMDLLLLGNDACHST